MLLAAHAIGVFGFALIAFSQKQHWALLRLSGSARTPGWLRPIGWMFLGIAAIPAVAREGLAFGLLLWTGALTVSVILVIGIILMLSKRGSKPDIRPDV